MFWFYFRKVILWGVFGGILVSFLTVILPAYILSWFGLNIFEADPEAIRLGLLWTYSTWLFLVLIKNIIFYFRLDERWY